jgi:hypothetical protein
MAIHKHGVKGHRGDKGYRYTICHLRDVTLTVSGWTWLVLGGIDRNGAVSVPPGGYRADG